MPLLETKGAGSAQGFGLSLGGEEAVYVEDVFSTYLYTGNGSTQTITNGIDLAGEGGLVWTKNRASANHSLIDTVRGASNWLSSNLTGASNVDTTLSGFNSNGYSLNGTAGTLNSNTNTYASWTFRKQPKFFDVVTYTGNSVAGRQISHSLGSAPGMVIIKNTSAAANWKVWHRGAPTAAFTLNDTTAGETTTAKYYFGDGSTVIQPTSTVFTVGGSDAGNAVNETGSTYVAYLFAHDAGGFGLEGTDNVISCGSFTTDVAGAATVTLGYEPQWAMVKISSGTGNWLLKDNMRGTPVGTAGPVLYPNLSSAEANFQTFSPNATGFTISGLGGSATYIYIAIRRGPMKVPTSGTEVFSPLTYTGSSTQGTLRNAGFTVDAVFSLNRSNETNKSVYDRLRGAARILLTTQIDAEVAQTGAAIGLFSFANNVGYLAGEDQSSATINFNPRTYVNYFFRRAPGFFDEVCYTGTGSARTVAHNLGSVPGCIIVKGVSDAGQWGTYHRSLGASSSVYLNSTIASFSSGFWDNTTPTATHFSVASTFPNNSGQTYVAYLFATLAGVSKVGSYTGTGTTQVINCGFTAGARFVLIKRTDSTGNWLVADSARGIVAGNDPLLYLNSTAAEITTLDWIDADSSGFIVNQEATANANVNAASYIYFAVA